jgi:hypothetical protein
MFGMRLTAWYDPRIHVRAVATTKKTFSEDKRSPEQIHFSDLHNWKKQ